MVRFSTRSTRKRLVYAGARPIWPRSSARTTTARGKGYGETRPIVEPPSLKGRKLAQTGHGAKQESARRVSHRSALMPNRELARSLVRSTNGVTTLASRPVHR